MPVGPLIDGWYSPEHAIAASTVTPASDPMAPAVGGVVAAFHSARRVGQASVEKQPPLAALPKIGAAISFCYDPWVIALLSGEL